MAFFDDFADEYPHNPNFDGDYRIAARLMAEHAWNAALDEVANKLGAYTLKTKRAVEIVHSLKPTPSTGKE